MRKSSETVVSVSEKWRRYSCYEAAESMVACEEKWCKGRAAVAGVMVCDGLSLRACACLTGWVACDFVGVVVVGKEVH